MKGKKAANRPLKYGEETTVIAFRVPKKNKKLIEEIKKFANKKLSKLEVK